MTDDGLRGRSESSPWTSGPKHRAARRYGARITRHALF